MATQQQIDDFAKIIKAHPAFDDVMALIQKDVFNKWMGLKTDDKDGLDNLKKIVDNQRLFINKLLHITEVADSKEPVNDDDGTERS